jgi:hypothetical protein
VCVRVCVRACDLSAPREVLTQVVHELLAPLDLASQVDDVARQVVDLGVGVALVRHVPAAPTALGFLVCRRSTH